MRRPRRPGAEARHGEAVRHGGTKRRCREAIRDTGTERRARGEHRGTERPGEVEEGGAEVVQGGGTEVPQGGGPERRAGHVSGGGRHSRRPHSRSHARERWGGGVEEAVEEPATAATAAHGNSPGSDDAGEAQGGCGTRRHRRRHRSHSQRRRPNDGGYAPRDGCGADRAGGGDDVGPERTHHRADGGCCGPRAVAAVAEGPEEWLGYHAPPVGVPGGWGGQLAAVAAARGEEGEACGLEGSSGWAARRAEGMEVEVEEAGGAQSSTRISAQVCSHHRQQHTSASSTSTTLCPPLAPTPVHHCVMTDGRLVPMTVGSAVRLVGWLMSHTHSTGLPRVQVPE